MEHLFREQPTTPRPAAPTLIARRYAALACACLLVLPFGWPWSLVAVWPAAAVAVVSVGYLGLGAGVFRKSGGRLPLGTRLLLGPYLLGAYLSFLQYRRLGPAYDEVIPGLLVGRRLSDAESAAAIRVGVRAVLDLTAEYPESRAFRELAYANVPILDLTLPTVPQLDAAVAWIHTHHARGTVYVHCALGYARSAAVVAAYLLAVRLAPSPAAALERVRRARPGVVAVPGLAERLAEFAGRRR